MSLLICNHVVEQQVDETLVHLTAMHKWSHANVGKLKTLLAELNRSLQNHMTVQWLASNNVNSWDLGIYLNQHK